MGNVIIPKSELEKLGDLVSYLVVQRELAKPVPNLRRILRDLRLVILGMIKSYYNPSNLEESELFVKEISDCLSSLQDGLDNEEFDEEFIEYCTGEIVSTFKKAGRIKLANPTVRGKLLDMLVLRSFDFKLKPLIRIVKSDFHTLSSPGDKTP